jgi:hypothetical protein
MRESTVDEISFLGGRRGGQLKKFYQPHAILTILNPPLGVKCIWQCTPMATSRTQIDHTQPPTNKSSYDPLKPATFVAPTPGNPYSVIIEFCDRVSTQPAVLLTLTHNVASVVGES